MSPEPATPATPVDVPATPTGALREDATAAAPVVLTGGALAQGTSSIACIADLSTKDYAGAYFEQVYFTPRTQVRFIDSRKGLVAMILAAAPAERLVLLLHSAGDQITFPDSGENFSLFDLTGDLLRIRGKFNRVIFDGCTLGTQPSSMFKFAEALQIQMVIGGTHSHAIGIWSFTLNPSHATSITPEAMAQLEVLARWLPLGEMGSHESATNLAALILREKRLVRAYEVFHGSLQDLDFRALVTQNSFDPSRHFERKALTDQVFLTLAEAQAADDMAAILGRPYRRIVAPHLS